MRYHVRVRQDPADAAFWLADVDGLAGAHASSRDLATLDRYVREVIILAADLPDDVEDTLQLDWQTRPLPRCSPGSALAPGSLEQWLRPWQQRTCGSACRCTPKRRRPAT